MKLFGDIQPAVKKETGHVATAVAIGTALMLALLFVCNRIWSDWLPFDYTVVLAAVVGSVVAVGNFFFMGLTVQRVAAEEDVDRAKNLMKASMARRTLIQMLWVVLAIVLPCFWFASGIAPLLFPSFGIKLRGIFSKNESNQKPVTAEEGEETEESEKTEETEETGENS